MFAALAAVGDPFVQVHYYSLTNVTAQSRTLLISRPANGTADPGVDFLASRLESATPFATRQNLSDFCKVHKNAEGEQCGIRGAQRLLSSVP